MTIKRIIGWSLFLSIVIGGGYLAWAVAGWLGIACVLIAPIISIGISSLIVWLTK